MAKSKGKQFFERVLAGQVRSKALEDVMLVLNDDPKTKEWSDLKKQLILKMSSNLLPRIHEGGGEGSEPIKISFDSAFNKDAEKSI